MAKYYALVAGLPALTAEMQRPPLSVADYYADLQPILTSRDRSYLELLHLELEHPELLDWVLGVWSGNLPAHEPSEESEEAPEHFAPLRLVIDAARHGRKLPKSRGIPDYQAHFVYDLYFVPSKTNEEEVEHQAMIDEIGGDRLTLENLLAQYYYEWAERSSSSFLREWFRLNKNIRNILAVSTCRRLGWDPSRYIVGQGPVEEALRHSRAKDFDLGEELPYLGEVLRIAEERDIARRERLLDLMKWQWMDEWTFVRVFDIDNVLCYYLRLSILERWSRLDEATGERTFREIVLGLKGESARVLQEFKQSQRR